ncbi:translation initiation factor 2 [Pseudosporangium ferrugineum]|uniref:Uncharacterized protein n=1 Tax=Pseudosporangium ferrugineum TaxID=439699 RepID=A0A2T0SDR4_9ACTN|nr:translation initiation factor 2 [Pseudosporangium ferrugineum]PRY31531.1 hypothetical protein CLV70_103418 [Pseudosporangium ferrugineum]
MLDQPEAFGPLQGGERILWHGHCAVAEYAFDRAASLPRWTLPETTEVLVTDRRLGYAYTSPEGITSGELRWLYPQHLRVQPGTRGRPASPTQIQLVCTGTDGSFPALVLAGGDVTEPAGADRLANVIRHAIARFRMDNAEKLGLTTPQARMLSRLLIGPEFTNYQGGEGQTVSVLGALPVPHQTPSVRPHPVPAHALPDPRPAHPAPGPAHALPEPPTTRSLAEPFSPTARPASEPARALPEPARPAGGGRGARAGGYRPGLAADEQRAQLAAAAEEAALRAEPDLASRAADLAARVAHLVAGAPEPEAERSEQPTTDLTARAERVRRAAARFAANSGRGKSAARHPDQEIGTTTRGNRNR